MKTHIDKAQENTVPTRKDSIIQKQRDTKSTFTLMDNRPEAAAQRKLQEVASNHAAQLYPIQKKRNNTGLPDNLKSGIENLSGYSMDDVKVQYNSDKPAQLNAHAYAQGTNIHLASGQEKHLPHEAWHVVQQKQGRVKPTMQLKGKVNINDDVGLEKEADVMGKAANQSGQSGMAYITTLKNSPVLPKTLIQHKRMAELHLADYQEGTKIVNDIEIFGARPDWGSFIDNMRGKNEQIRHERAWDELKDDVREELTGNRDGFGSDYTLNDMKDYLVNQGYDNILFTTKKRVEKIVDQKLEDTYKDLDNLWSGEKKDNMARGSLLGVLKGYKNKTDLGIRQVLRYSLNNMNIVDQNRWTLPTSAYTIEVIDVNPVIFGEGPGLERIQLIKGNGVMIAIQNLRDLQAGTWGCSDNWLWREKKKYAYAVHPNFNPKKREELLTTGINSSNKYFGDLNIQGTERLSELHELAVNDISPIFHKWTPEATELDFLRMKKIEQEVNAIIGFNDRNLNKKAKYKINSYKSNFYPIAERYETFHNHFGLFETIPHQFVLQRDYARNLKDKIDRNS